MTYWLIFLHSGELVISRKQYKNWEAIQKAWENYMTSLQFANWQELYNWIMEEYPDEACQLTSRLDTFNHATKEEMML